MRGEKGVNWRMNCRLRWIRKRIRIQFSLSTCNRLWPPQWIYRTIIMATTRRTIAKKAIKRREMNIFAKKKRLCADCWARWYRKTKRMRATLHEHARARVQRGREEWSEQIRFPPISFLLYYFIWTVELPQSTTRTNVCIEMGEERTKKKQKNVWIRLMSSIACRFYICIYTYFLFCFYRL